MPITFDRFKVWLAGQSVPSAVEVTELLKQDGALLGDLTQKAAVLPGKRADRLKLIEVELKELKQEIPFKNGNVDPDGWQGKREEERRRLGDALDGLFMELKSLNRDELRLGRDYFLIFCLLLLVVSGVYLGLHARRPPGSVNPALIAEISKDLRSIELEIKSLTKAKSQGESGNPEDLKRQVSGLGEKVKGVDLGFSTLQLLGTVESEAERGEIVETDSFARFSRTLLADLESLQGALLWNDRRGRWFEIAWWAEIGVLVGILFYLAGCLGRGRFASGDIPMFWTEVLIAPIVVVAIFFLFTLTGITGISPSETSITGNVGVAFIFGFAIRRTLGLVDTIKKRIFPDPEAAT